MVTELWRLGATELAATIARCEVTGHLCLSAGEVIERAANFSALSWLTRANT